VLLNQARQTSQAEEINSIEKEYNATFVLKQKTIDQLVAGISDHDDFKINEAKSTYGTLKHKEDSLRAKTKIVIANAIPSAKTQDKDYIFLNFVLTHLPHGVIGLLLAVMFSAAMSSMSSELNALASTTTVDVYRRVFTTEGSATHYLNSSKFFTVAWALIAMVFASLANFAENLIQFVNIVGSLFYGTILGIFLVAFYIKKVKSNAVFWSAVIGEAVVLTCYLFYYDEIAFLYYNIIGCVVVVILSILFQIIFGQKEKATV
jgi:Na+/proline symporter